MDRSPGSTKPWDFEVKAPSFRPLSPSESTTKRMKIEEVWDWTYKDLCTPNPEPLEEESQFETWADISRSPLQPLSDRKSKHEKEHQLESVWLYDLLQTPTRVLSRRNEDEVVNNDELDFFRSLIDIEQMASPPPTLRRSWVLPPVAPRSSVSRHRSILRDDGYELCPFSPQAFLDPRCLQKTQPYSPTQPLSPNGPAFIGDPSPGLPVNYKFAPYTDLTDEYSTYDEPDYFTNFDTPKRIERFDRIDLQVRLTQIPTFTADHPLLMYLGERILSGDPTPAYREAVTTLINSFKTLHRLLQQFSDNHLASIRLFGDSGDYEDILQETRQYALTPDQDRQLLDLLGRFAHLEWQIENYGQESGTFGTSDTEIDHSLKFKQRCMWNMGQRASLGMPSQLIEASMAALHSNENERLDEEEDDGFERRMITRRWTD